MNKNTALISAVSPHIYLQQPKNLCFFFKWFKLHYVKRAKFNNLAFCSARTKVMLVHLCSTPITRWCDSRRMSGCERSSWPTG